MKKRRERLRLEDLRTWGLGEKQLRQGPRAKTQRAAQTCPAVSGGLAWPLWLGSCLRGEWKRWKRRERFIWERDEKGERGERGKGGERRKGGGSSYRRRARREEILKIFTPRSRV